MLGVDAERLAAAAAGGGDAARLANDVANTSRRHAPPLSTALRREVVVAYSGTSTDTERCRFPGLAVSTAKI